MHFIAPSRIAEQVAASTAENVVPTVLPLTKSDVSYRSLLRAFIDG
jgi:hypothetical protein